MGIKGNWYFGNLSILKKDIDHIKSGYYISNSVGLPFAYEIRPETIGQFTGLLDKNGNEVFEGDIILIKDNKKIVNDYISEIEWNNKELSFGFKKSLHWQRPCESLWCWIIDCEIEVLGNIFENPKLLN